MNDWKVIPTIVFTTVLIFGAGVFTGGMLVDYVKQNHQRMANNANANPNRPHPQSSSQPATNNVPPVNPSAAQASRPVKPPEILSKDLVQRLDADLHLTKEEHDSIQRIVSEGQNEMRKVVQDARLEIREVLTEEQRKQFDELMKRPFHKPLFTTNAVPPMAPAPVPATTNAPANLP